MNKNKKQLYVYECVIGNLYEDKFTPMKTFYAAEVYMAKAYFSTFKRLGLIDGIEFSSIFEAGEMHMEIHKHRVMHSGKLCDEYRQLLKSDLDQQFLDYRNNIIKFQENRLQDFQNQVFFFPE